MFAGVHPQHAAQQQQQQHPPQPLPAYQNRSDNMVGGGHTVTWASACEQAPQQAAYGNGGAPTAAAAPQAQAFNAAKVWGRWVARTGFCQRNSRLAMLHLHGLREGGMHAGLSQPLLPRSLSAINRLLHLPCLCAPSVPGRCHATMRARGRRAAPLMQRCTTSTTCRTCKRSWVQAALAVGPALVAPPRA